MLSVGSDYFRALVLSLIHISGLQADYSERFLTPYQAAERGFVDAVIDPADTRVVVSEALDVLSTRREVLPGRKHTIGPM